MELIHNNPNGEIDLASKFDYVEKFLFNIVKVAFKNESYKLFFQEDVQSA